MNKQDLRYGQKVYYIDEINHCLILGTIIGFWDSHDKRFVINIHPDKEKLHLQVPKEINDCYFDKKTAVEAFNNYLNNIIEELKTQINNFESKKIK